MGRRPRIDTHVGLDGPKATIGSRRNAKTTVIASSAHTPTQFSRSVHQDSTVLGHLFTDYPARWMIIAVFLLVSVDWLLALRIPVDYGSVLPKLEFLCVPLVFAALFAGVGNRMPRLRRPLAVVTDCCLSMAQVLAVLAALLPLTYLAATTGFPLVDDRLVHLDAMVGFDWNSAAQWVRERPAIDWIFQQAYFCVPYEAAVVLMIGSFKLERNGELIWLFIVSGMITCVIFAFTPALGKIGHLGTGQIDILSEIRRGDWSIMDYNRAEGIVNFPSFHTTLAIILTYSVRHYRWALAVFAPINGLMLLAIPTVGGHYLVDLLGGAAVAGLAILLVHLLRRPLRRVDPL